MKYRSDSGSTELPVESPGVKDKVTISAYIIQEELYLKRSDLIMYFLSFEDGADIKAVDVARWLSTLHTK